jgi:hypothetical protein
MRPLTVQETTAATNYLAILEIIIRREIPNFEARLAEADFSLAVEYVEASIVADILRNPNRLQYEQAGDYSYSLQRVLQVESLRKAISEDQWWMLGVSKGGAFTIDTAVFANNGGRSPRWWNTIERRS